MERINQVRVKYGDDDGHLLPLRWDEEENHYFIRLSDVWEVYPKATGLIWRNDKEEHLPRKFRVFNKNRASEVWAVNIYAPNYSDEFWNTKDLILYVDTQLRLDDEIDFLMGVSFSGGGSRAAGFHLGAFQRLLEVGLLRFIDTFSAVSGGSLALGFIAVAWEDLCYCDFSPESLRWLVLEPLRKFLKYNFAVQTAISIRKKIWDRLVHKQSSSKYLSEQYENAEREGKKLVKKMPEFIAWKTANYPDYDFPSLEGKFSLPLSKALVDPEFRMPDTKEGRVHYEAQVDLWRQKKAQQNQPVLQGPLKGFGPAKINPLFVFCGTDVRTGLPFYFTQRTVGPLYDTKEEIMVNDDVPQSYSVPLAQARELATKIKLSQALAASSGFPIFFSPLEIPYKSAYNEDLIAYIADGAIYDNIGMDPFNGMQYYKKLPHMMIMVSDAGAPVPEVQKPSSSTIFSALRDNDLLNSQAVRLRKQILKKKVALEMMDGALWGLDDIWDYYYAIYYDLIKHEQTPKDMILKAKNSKPDVKSMTMSEVRQASDSSSEHFQSLAEFLRNNTPGFPDLSPLFNLEKLKSIHDDLTQLTGFRTDLDCLSEDEINVLEMAGYTLSAYSILRYCSERFSLLGVTQINPARAYNTERYQAIAASMSKSLKYAGNHFVSFFLNNLFKK